jgi:hypothetical protein
MTINGKLAAGNFIPAKTKNANYWVEVWMG